MEGQEKHLQGSVLMVPLEPAVYTGSWKYVIHLILILAKVGGKPNFVNLFTITLPVKVFAKEFCDIFISAHRECVQHLHELCVHCKIQCRYIQYIYIQ